MKGNKIFKFLTIRTQKIKKQNWKFGRKVLVNTFALSLVTQTGYWNGLLLKEINAVPLWKNIIITDLISFKCDSVKILNAGIF